MPGRMNMELKGKERVGLSRWRFGKVTWVSGRVGLG